MTEFKGPHKPVADPGFPVGGHGPVSGGCGSLTWALFAKNVCENKRIWSCRGGVHQAHPLDPPMHMIHNVFQGTVVFQKRGLCGSDTYSFYEICSFCEQLYNIVSKLQGY